MRELLRIIHGSQTGIPGHILRDYNLRDYNLSVREGEIIYIQGDSASGIDDLPDFFSGKSPITGGVLQILEQKKQSELPRIEKNDGIYTISGMKDLILDMTVTENLEIVRSIPRAFRYYNPRKTENIIQNYLKESSIPADAASKLRNLDTHTLLRISLLKAKIHGARIIVFDCTRGSFEGMMTQEVFSILHSFKKNGISTLILSERYLNLSLFADRVQLLSQGRDLMEWKDEIVTRQMMAIEYPARSCMDTGDFTTGIWGITDQEWSAEKTVWDYILTVKKSQREKWDSFFSFTVTENKQSMYKGTVIVPKESGNQLISSLSIEDNLILAIPQRISKSKYGMIPERIKKTVAKGFMELLQIPGTVKSVRELTYLQRKILSIYRFEIARPVWMILDTPHWGMDQNETEAMHRYIRHLAERGINILYFSRTIEELLPVCSKIFVTENGKQLRERNHLELDKI